VIAMFLVVLLCLVIAGAVAVYVGFARRGEEVPHAPWLGDAMRRGVAALPTIGNQAQAPDAERIPGGFPGRTSGGLGGPAESDRHAR